MITELYLLFWRQHDNSAFGVKKIYLHKKRAEQDLDLVKDNTDKKHWIEIYDLEI